MRPFLLAVCGLKHTGKTTLLEGLLQELSRRGIRAGVIKHDGHDFEPDREGTDTWRHMQAGAEAAVIFSKNRIMAVQKRQDADSDEVLLERLASSMDGMDIIFVEGLKESCLPKIETVGKNHGQVANPEGLIAVVPWEEAEGFWRTQRYIPVFSFRQTGLLCDRIWKERNRRKGEADEIRKSEGREL